MKIPSERKQIKDFKVALKDLEPVVKNPQYLWNGRDISNFSLRPREAWANWLLCVVFKKIHGDRITFAEDSEGDGIIVDKLSGLGIPTEHVSALEVPKRKKPLPQGEDRVIQAIKQKIGRGPEYAKGKYLVVFFDGAGLFYRNKIREAIFRRHNFVAVYCIGLLRTEGNCYIYSVTEFMDSHGDKSITFIVTVNMKEYIWEIKQQME